MTTLTTSASNRLIRRVNQLYHELTHETFDDVHARRFTVERNFWEQVAQRVLATEGSAMPDGRTVVDLGCGTGFVGTILAGYLRGTDRLIPLDVGRRPVRTSIARARTSVTDPAVGPTVAGAAMDAASIPLPDEAVDFVGMNAALHHMPDPPAVLREIDRILKPGGYFALGFEPNRLHFDHPVIGSANRLTTRLAWYASPHQNRRRCRQWWNRLTGQDTEALRSSTRAAGHNDIATRTINQRLHREGVIAQDLSAEAVLNLVDPHSRGPGRTLGFDPSVRRNPTMRGYRVIMQFTSDYLGESLRAWPWTRYGLDGLARGLMPWHGSLFSWLLQKPAATSEVCR